MRVPAFHAPAVKAAQIRAPVMPSRYKRRWP